MEMNENRQEIEKHKRTRRGPRSRGKQQFEVKWSPVAQPHGVLLARHIPQNNCINVALQTGCYTISTQNLDSILGKIEQKNETKARKRHRKKTKAKQRKRFPDYLDDETISIGLNEGYLFAGPIRINPKNPQDAYVNNADRKKNDHQLQHVVDRNRALEGDEVYIRIDQDPIKVVGIKRKNHPRTAVGFLRLNTNKIVEFLPRDRRFPKLRLDPQHNPILPDDFLTNPDAHIHTLFVAELVDWLEIEMGVGRLVRMLGRCGDICVETEAILHDCRLSFEAHPDYQRHLSPTIPPKEFDYRLDYRDKCVFTIDPATARDLDDAVSCELLPNGNFEIGVHIADASFYLMDGNELDEAVKKRATTIYLVDQTHHMLPPELCVHCSLLPGQDKLTFTVLWEVTPNGDVVNERITRSIINSCAQLTYEQAQLMMDEPISQWEKGALPMIYNDHTARHLCEKIINLEKIAVELRRKRMMNGALKIDQIKISFKLDEISGKPLGFHQHISLPAHRLIEELMLLANMTVARHLLTHYPDLAFLRRHDSPKMVMLEELKKNLEVVGLHFDMETAGSISASLSKYDSNDFFGEARMVVLNHLIAKTMIRAQYFCAGLADTAIYHHYALSIPLYTHFTSPIRRYADIVVHRLMAASLDYRPLPEITAEQIGEIAEICNIKKYAAKKAGEESCNLFLAQYIDDHQPFIQHAVVTEVRQHSIDAIVLATGSLVRLRHHELPANAQWQAEKIGDDQSDRSAYRAVIMFKRTHQQPPIRLVLDIFSLISVKLTRRPKTNKLDAELVRPMTSRFFPPQI